jgi:predicted RNA-binding Zn-ribbon protein involved in translation (DUF1610 family)
MTGEMAIGGPLVITTWDLTTTGATIYWTPIGCVSGAAQGEMMSDTVASFDEFVYKTTAYVWECPECADMGISRSRTGARLAVKEHLNGNHGEQEEAR